VPADVADLVLFDDVIRHLIRISRVLHTPGGHALVVGGPALGKASVARLASFIAGFRTYRLSLNRYSLSVYFLKFRFYKLQQLRILGAVQIDHVRSISEFRSVYNGKKISQIALICDQVFTTSLDLSSLFFEIRLTYALSLYRLNQVKFLSTFAISTSFRYILTLLEYQEPPQYS